MNSPNVGTDRSFLVAVAAISPSDAWAVGYHYTVTTTHALIEHWDGAQWAIVPDADPGTSSHQLAGVAAIAPDDVWAVGTRDYGATLAEHWDGTQWSVVPTPNGPAGLSTLNAITAISTNDVWAVGSDYETVYRHRFTLVEHWDGVQWSVVPSPSVAGQLNILNVIVAITPTDIWAVGYLILHWDGSKWSIVPSPSPPQFTGVLSGVAALSANDIWAVGNYGGELPNPSRMLVEHWDGTQWSIVPSPTVGQYGDFLRGIIALSDDDIWAVGYQDDGTARSTLLLHWNGSAWSPIAAPNPSPIINQVDSIAASESQMWIVGNYFPDTGGFNTLVENYNRACPSPTPSPTLTPLSTPTPLPTLSPPATYTPIPTPSTTPACALSWERVTSPNAGEYVNNSLKALAVVSADDIWAVGDILVDGLALHWDGSNWSIIPTAHLGSGYHEVYFNSVTALATNDIWIAGYYRFDQGRWLTLTEHWDGVRWNLVHSPTLTDWGSQLWGISAVSANDIWAVGNATFSSLTIHWDGSDWSVIPSPNVGENYASELYGVTAISANDVWAVGAGIGSLAMHWNGIEWSIVPIAQPGGDRLWSVSASAPDDVWAVGVYTFDGYRTLIEHWDGTRWRVVAAHNSGIGPFLKSVTAFSRYGAWAVGDDYHHFLTMRWDGFRWNAVPMASLGPNEQRLNAVAAVSPSEVWAVGDVRGPSNGWKRTLTERTTGSLVAFSDVPPTNVFYPYVRCLACQGIISGYPDGTFKPNNSVSRGQLSKIVANAARFSGPTGEQQYQDVAPGSTFFDYVWRLSNRGIMSGYRCGAAGEPCVPPDNLPYFRPNTNASRGQISKIVSNAAGFADAPSGQQFEDVRVDSTFYTYIYRLVSRSIMFGYPCGGAREPCVPPQNRPYFRPNNNATRGQTSKIVGNTFFSTCQTP